jgi:hypothetical protein
MVMLGRLWETDDREAAVFNLRKQENLMNKLQRSWLLMKSSLSVVGRNKPLLAF